VDQRLTALAEANRIRTQRAQLKRNLKSRQTSIHELLLHPPDWVKTMKVCDAILACPKYGRVKTDKLLHLCRISPSKTIGGMSARQRDELASLMKR